MAKENEAVNKEKNEEIEMNEFLELNELLDEIIATLEADAYAERKIDNENRCDLSVVEFMEMFLEKMEGISRIPFKLIFYVYQES